MNADRGALHGRPTPHNLLESSRRCASSRPEDQHSSVGAQAAVKATIPQLAHQHAPGPHSPSTRVSAAGARGPTPGATRPSTLTPPLLRGAATAPPSEVQTTRPPFAPRRGRGVPAHPRAGAGASAGRAHDGRAQTFQAHRNPSRRLFSATLGYMRARAVVGLRVGRSGVQRGRRMGLRLRAGC